MGWQIFRDGIMIVNTVSSPVRQSHRYVKAQAPTTRDIVRKVEMPPRNPINLGNAVLVRYTHFYMLVTGDGAIGRREKQLDVDSTVVLAKEFVHGPGNLGRVPRNSRDVLVGEVIPVYDYKRPITHSLTSFSIAFKSLFALLSQVVRSSTTSRPKHGRPASSSML